MTDQAKETKPASECIACRSDIHSAATVCASCGKYQHWFRRLLPLHIEHWISVALLIVSIVQLNSARQERADAADAMKAANAASAKALQAAQQAEIAQAQVKTAVEGARRALSSARETAASVEKGRQLVVDVGGRLFHAVDIVHGFIERQNRSDDSYSNLTRWLAENRRRFKK